MFTDLLSSSLSSVGMIALAYYTSSEPGSPSSTGSVNNMMRISDSGVVVTQNNQEEIEYDGSNRRLIHLLKPRAYNFIQTK